MSVDPLADLAVAAVFDALSIPMTYRLRPDGRQFVVIAAGGHGTLGTRQGDWLVAYALPERSRR